MADASIVTLLFTDLVGSTEQRDRVGDDAAEELRRTHFGLLRDAVAGHGGQEVKGRHYPQVLLRQGVRRTA